MKRLYVTFILLLLGATLYAQYPLQYDENNKYSVSTPVNTDSMNTIAYWPLDNLYSFDIIDTIAYLGGKNYFKTANYSDILNPYEISSLILSGSVLEMTVNNDYAYLMIKDTAFVAPRKLYIIDISDPSSLSIVSSGPVLNSYYIDFSGAHIYTGSHRIAYSDNYVFITDGEAGGVHIYDVSDPFAPIDTGYIHTGSRAWDVDVSGNTMYVTDLDIGKLHIYDIEDRGNPIKLTDIQTDAMANQVMVSGNYAYVSSDRSGLYIVDIADPSNPFIAGHFRTYSEWSTSMAIQDSLAYICDGPDGLKVADISDVTNPVQVAYYEPGHNLRDLLAYDSYLFYRYSGIRIIQYDPNEPPEAFSYDTTTYEDQSLNLILDGNDVDGTVEFSVLDSAVHGTLSGIPSDLLYSPDPNYVGIDSIHFLVTDNENAKDTGSIVISITAVNDAPVANNDQFSTHEETSLEIILTASDIDSENLYYSIFDSTSHGKLSGDPPNINYISDTNYNGYDSLHFIVSDGELADTGTVIIDVQAINDPPIAISYDTTTYEDQSLNLILDGSDVDGSVEFSVLDSAVHGTLSGIPSDLLYSPDPNYVGIDSIHFLVTDNEGAKDTGSIVISITAVNDAPVANNDQLSTHEETSLEIILTASDIDSENLYYSIFDSTSHGKLSGDPPNINYISDTNYNGYDSLHFIVSDGELADTGTVIIDVQAINDPPIATSYDTTTYEDQSLSLILDGNDVDGTVEFSVLDSAVHGTLSGIPSDLLYSPDTNYFGNDSIHFLITDNVDAKDTGSIVITVTPVNDAPLATFTETNINKDEINSITLTASAGAANESDQALEYILRTLPETGNLYETENGEVILQDVLPLKLSDPLIYYTSAISFDSTSFIYNVQDNGGRDFSGVDTSLHREVMIYMNKTPISILPDQFTLKQNYPNPFNPSTKIEYSLPISANVKLSIFNIYGHKIKEWSITDKRPGWYEVIWDGTDINGNIVPTGVYIYSLRSGDLLKTLKMILIK